MERASPRRGRLRKDAREAAIDIIIRSIVERGETRYRELARLTGLNRNSVPALVRLARERIARECPPPPQLRQTYLARLETVFRQAMEGHERAKHGGDERAANDYLRTATDAVGRAGRVAGLEEATKSSEAAPKFRIVFERWEDSAPPAALAGVARLSAASGPAALPRTSGTHEDRRRAGARWGKDTACMMEMARLVTAAATIPQRQASGLIPKVHAWVVGPSFPLLAEPWRLLRRMLPPEIIMRTNESRMTVELAGDILIEFKSAERPETLVSSGLDVLVMVEAALIPQEAWETSLRPRLASPGRLGLMIASGTPKGRNWFYRLFLEGQNPQNAEVWSARFATWDNPLVSRDEIESMRDSMAARSFAQEIEGEFVSDEGAVFRGVRSCIVSARTSQGQVTLGIDWGQRQDSTVLVALDATGHVVGFDAFRRIPWSQILDRVEDFARASGASTVIPEANSVGDPLCEELQNRLSDTSIAVMPFVTTSASKQRAIDRLALGIEQRRISYPDIPQLINELEVFEYVTTASGGVRFSARAGQHDDAVMALAFAYDGATQRLLDYGPAGAYVPPRSGGYDDGW